MVNSIVAIIGLLAHGHYPATYDHNKTCIVRPIWVNNKILWVFCFFRLSEVNIGIPLAVPVAPGQLWSLYLFNLLAHMMPWTEVWSCWPGQHEPTVLWYWWCIELKCGRVGLVRGQQSDDNDDAWNWIVAVLAWSIWANRCWPGQFEPTVLSYWWCLELN